MLGTQFHPELQSRPNRPHPLFHAFVAAGLARRAPQTETVTPAVAAS